MMKQLPVSSRGNGGRDAALPSPLQTACLSGKALSAWDSSIPSAAPCAQGWSYHGAGQHPLYILSDGRMPGQRDEGSWSAGSSRSPFVEMTRTLNVAYASFGRCPGPLLRAAVWCAIFPVPCLSSSSWVWTRTEASCLQLVCASQCPATLLGTLAASWLGDWSLGRQMLWRLQGASWRPIEIWCPLLAAQVCVTVLWPDSSVI